MIRMCISCRITSSTCKPPAKASRHPSARKPASHKSFRKGVTGAVLHPTAIALKIRLRYQCHYKVRHPQLCDGQSGYGVATLDGIVEKAIHQLFDRVKTIPEDEMIQSQMRKEEADCKAQLTRAKVLCNRREKELSDYQSEVLKVIRGESQLSMAIINELIEKAEGMLQEAKKDEAHWTEELDNIQQKAAEMHKLYGKVVSWSELFDTCNMSEKKMIVSQLIRQCQRQNFFDPKRRSEMTHSAG